ncbi:MAG: hypothetical protein II075_05285, partial [Bacteroidales bacterium]|nr:hypothetical protein [Bacteroidales bacterium]
MKFIAFFILPLMAAAVLSCTAGGAARGGQTAPAVDSVAAAAVVNPQDTIKPIQVAAEDTAAYMPI